MALPALMKRLTGWSPSSWVMALSASRRVSMPRSSSLPSGRFRTTGSTFMAVSAHEFGCGVDGHAGRNNLRSTETHDLAYGLGRLAALSH